MKKLIFLLITITLLMSCVSFRNDIVKPKIDENDPIVKKLREIGVPYRKGDEVKEDVVYHSLDNPLMFFYFTSADLLEIRYYEAQGIYEFCIVYEDLVSSNIVDANFYFYNLTPEQEEYIRLQKYNMAVRVIFDIKEKTRTADNIYLFNSDKALNKPIRTFSYFDPDNPVE